MTRKLFIYLFIISVGYFIAFKLTYKKLENEWVYNTFFSSFMPTYENQNGQILVAKKPFSKISESGYVTMDAAHYSYIKDNLYKADPNDPDTNFNYGFFPLFPLVWKFFSNFGVVTLNYFLHFASVVLLAFAFCRSKLIMAVLTILALPTLTVFLLPYTEALFMFSISLAVFGYKEKNNYIYITGLALASATRPVFLLFLGAFFINEAYRYLQGKKSDYRLFLITSAVVTFVTLLVSMFQCTFHKGSIFTFMTVQKHWGTYFRFPETINDWSTEGYGMNVFALLFVLIFGIAILTYTLFKKEKTESSYDYWYSYSWIYLVSTCIYVLLFQGGTLHSLYRYTLCSPFFYIIIFQHINNISSSARQTFLILACFFVACFAFFKIAPYAPDWNFSKTGFILLSLNLLFFIFNNRYNFRSKYFVYGILIIGGILWNSYLYNMFFSKAWIFL